MTETLNRVVRLKRRPPPGLPGPETWDIRDEPLAPLKDGEVRVRVRFISIEAPMRHWITPITAGFFKPVEEGDVMRSADVVGEVVESCNPAYAAGDLAVGMFGVQLYWTGTPAPTMRKLEPGHHPPERYLGVLGASGLTAYFGMLDVAKVQPGETVLVSSAAGVVGALAGQIGKIKGCRVIGVAGGEKKCRYVVETLGFDACIDYKAEDVFEAVPRLAPEGLDVFFDNVGGEILEAALDNLKNHARITLSGAISEYNDIANAKGPRNYLNLRRCRSRMEGFMCPDYADQFEAARREIGGWLDEGRCTALEHIEEGIDRFPEVMPMLFTGANFGKLILKL